MFRKRRRRNDAKVFLEDDSEDTSESESDSDDDHKSGRAKITTPRFGEEFHAHNNSQDKKVCQVCLQNDASLVIEDCAHQCLCKECYADQTEDSADAYCPVCLKQITQISNVEIWKNHNPKEPSLEVAFRVRLAKLASTVLEKHIFEEDYVEKSPENLKDTPSLSIFEVSEKDINHCFGLSHKLLFSDIRYMVCFIIFISISSVGYLYSSITSKTINSVLDIQLAGEQIPVAKSDPVGWFLQFTLIVCSSKKCTIPWWFVAIENLGIWILFLGSIWMEKRVQKLIALTLEDKDDSELALSFRCVGVVQAPHIVAEISPKLFKKFGKVSCVVTGSSRNHEYVNLIETRLLDRLKRDSFERQMRVLNPNTKEYANANFKCKVYNGKRNVVAEKITKLFAQETNQLINRRHPPVEYAFVLFEKPSSAEKFREWLSPKRSSWFEQIRMVFASPNKRFGLLGHKNGTDCYPQNINWSALQYPYMYAQSEHPVYRSLNLAFIFLCFYVLSYVLLDTCLKTFSTELTSVAFFFWFIASQKLSKHFVKQIHFQAFCSQQEIFVLKFVIYGVMPLILLLPLYVRRQQTTIDSVSGYYPLLGKSWWSEFMGRFLLVFSFCYLGYFMFYDFLFKMIIMHSTTLHEMFMKNFFTQRELNKFWEGRPWSIANGYIDTLQLLVFIIAFSGVVPMLTMFAAPVLVGRYFTRKSYLVRFCTTPTKLFTPSFSKFTWNIMQTALIFRLVVMGGFFLSMPMKEEELNVNAIIPFASIFPMLYIIFHRNLEPTPFYSWILKKLVWTCEEGINPAAARLKKEKLKRKLDRKIKQEDTKFDLLKRKGLSKEEYQKKERKIIEQFDITKSNRYEDFFENVQTIKDLDIWEETTAKNDGDIID